MTPRLCLVTDSRRLCAAAGANLSDAADLLVAQAQAAAEAGVDLLQVRESARGARALADLTRRVMTAVAGSRLRVVVNDRLDVALASGADGVHLRADSLQADVVRARFPRRLCIGRSVHDVDEVRAAGGVDYLLAGTVFPSVSKGEGARTCGLAGFAQMARSTTVPVLALGGVTVATWPALRKAGAAGLAGIGLFIPDQLSTVSDLLTHCRWVRQAVDTAQVVT